MKCKVFVDTNSLMNDKNGPLNILFNDQISELRKFIDHHKQGDKVVICIPEIVIRERIQHKLEQIDLAINTFNQQASLLRGVEHKIRAVKNRGDYRKILEKNTLVFLKENNVEKIKTPDVTTKEMLDRAIDKVLPFKDNTAGFKDTLIYLSMEADAIKNKVDNYIFCTNDSGFNDVVCEQFLQKTGKKLHLVPYIYHAQQKLSEILPLDLHLEKRDKDIKNLIFQNLGLIVAEANRTLNKKDDFVTGSYAFSTPLYWSTPSPEQDSEENIVGFNYLDLMVTSIQDIDSNLFAVETNLTTEIVYRDNDEVGNTNIFNQVRRYNKSIGASHVSSSISGLYNLYPKVTRRDFKVTLACNMETKNVSVFSIVPGFDSII